MALEGEGTVFAIIVTHLCVRRKESPGRPYLLPCFPPFQNSRLSYQQPDTRPSSFFGFQCRWAAVIWRVAGCRERTFPWKATRSQICFLRKEGVERRGAVYKTSFLVAIMSTIITRLYQIAPRWSLRIKTGKSRQCATAWIRRIFFFMWETLTAMPIPKAGRFSKRWAYGTARAFLWASRNHIVHCK